MMSSLIHPSIKIQILRAKLYELELQRQQAEIYAKRKSQVGAAARAGEVEGRRCRKTARVCVCELPAGKAGRRALPCPPCHTP